MTDEIREPTSDECNTKKRVPLYADRDAPTAVAAWYPQMGGYGAKCLIVTDGEETPVPGTAAASVGGCFDCYVWHDGQFPFSEQPPQYLHHCDAAQFIAFGQLVHRIQADMGPVKFTEQS